MRSLNSQTRRLLTDLAASVGERSDPLYDLEEAKVDSQGLIECPLLPLREMVLYPHMVTPVLIGRERSLDAIAVANQNEETIIAATQRDSSQNDPEQEDLYKVGTEIAVGRMLRMPDGSSSVVAQGRRRVEIVEYVLTEPYYRVRARPMEEATSQTAETEALMRAVLTLFEKCVQLDRSLPEEAYIFAMNVDDPGWLADLTASSLNLELAERQAVLETFDPVERLQQVSSLLGKELNLLELEDKIHTQVKQKVDRGQREFYLREQMIEIQRELGEGDPLIQEMVDLRQNITAAGMPEEIKRRALKELGRLTKMQPLTPEIVVVRSYLDVLLELPWQRATKDTLDLNYAKEMLDSCHYGLSKAKDRILEYMAVRSLAGEKNTIVQPILCFVGPPGTGKTSLGRSIAEALGRRFVRVSLGGVRDEAEIRGHRRTYIGALPGRIIQAMRKAGSINPLFMLDEIDKLGQDFRGDPSSALLEVLDPEQNCNFSDHYLEVPYDLSNVMFITTANYLGPLTPALEDRLEVIEFSGYVEEDKVEIAQRFLVPRQLGLNGLEQYNLSFPSATIKTIIREYTYEAGVRNLEREVANVCRKVARTRAEGKRAPSRLVPRHLQRLLGPPRFNNLETESQDEIGVATSLAWTISGGDISVIEVALLDGKGDLKITGQVGEVMQESAHAALSHLRSRSTEFSINRKIIDKTDIHLHIPEGAIPKDGPSAGITIATALASAFTGRKVRREVGMTGEITLRGRVLPVGGVKEKVLTARRAGLKTVIMPKKNEKDLVELPRQARRELNFVLVEQLDEVLQAALLPRPKRNSTNKTTMNTGGTRKKTASKERAAT